MWIARDDDGTLGLYSEKPSRTNEYGCWGIVVKNDNQFSVMLEPELFHDLNWSDNPLEVELKEINHEQTKIT